MNKMVNMIKLEAEQKFIDVDNGKQFAIETGIHHMLKFSVDLWIFLIVQVQEIGIQWEVQIFGLPDYILKTMEINGKMN